MGTSFMIKLLLCLLLLLVTVPMIYQLSAPFKAKRRMRNAFSPFEELDAEARKHQQQLSNDVDSAFSEYVHRVHAARLQAIPVDELKHHASGMRLQALKDAGIRSVADLQGWNEYRVAEVRGVGPKSAYAIVQAVAKVTAASIDVPIEHPVPSFRGDGQLQLMQVLYRQLWFDTHCAEQCKAFQENLRLRSDVRDELLQRMGLLQWICKLGKSESLRQDVIRSQQLIEELGSQELQSLQVALSKSFEGFRGAQASHISPQILVENFQERKTFYDLKLADRLGPSVGSEYAKMSSRKIDTVRSLTADDVCHVEFGRIVPGPPPPPTGENPRETVHLGDQIKPMEQLFSMTIGPGAPKPKTSFGLPLPAQVKVSAKAHWRREGDSVEIQGHTLSVGFIYVGENLSVEEYFALDTALPAKPWRNTAAEAPVHAASYRDLSPAQRTRYLEWLGTGSGSPSDAAFGMLYFFGLERRILDLIREEISGFTAEDRSLILVEVRRLGLLFQGLQGNVTQCCTRLLEFATCRFHEGTSLPELPTLFERSYELPMIMRYGLGCLVRDQQPVPVEWALRWVYVEPTIYLRTPATRCPDVFEKVFAYLYQEECGAGLIVPTNTTRLKMAYQPGWFMHPQPDVKTSFSNIPDVTTLSVPQQRLKEIAEQSTTLIDQYSRYLGRNSSRAGTIEALLNLPVLFWPAQAKEQWQIFYTDLVEPIQPLTYQVLLHNLGYIGDPNAARITELAGSLARVLVGVEPDVLSGSRRPKPSELIALFPLTSEIEPDRGSAEYKRASLTVSLSACIALADGVASTDEDEAVAAMINSWQHLDPDLRTRLWAQYRLQLRQAVSMTSLKARFSDLPEDGRIQMAIALSSLATVDGNVAAAEVKLLEQVYRLLDLDPQLLYRHLHQGGSNRSHSFEAQKIDGLQTASARPIDSIRLAELRRETEQVSKLLAQVFVDNEGTDNMPAERAAPAVFVEVQANHDPLPGLDLNHRRFLDELLQRPVWTRSELQQVAANVQIMLDGALERINEAAFDHFGEPLTEGDDPIYVEKKILENIC